MPSWPRCGPTPTVSLVVSLVVWLVVWLAALAGCSQAPLPGAGKSPASEDAELGSVSEGTCWAGARLGADPQEVLKLSSRFHVPYLAAARAVADRPAFTDQVECADDHSVEVYKVLRLPTLDAQLTDYASLLTRQTPLYEKVGRALAKGCMTGPLPKAAEQSGLRGAVMSPVLPEGTELGWAPSAPDEWAAGRRVFACTVTWPEPTSIRYATVFTKAFPTGRRTCISSRSLVFVDCARRHDRERIASIDAREAVAAGEFPGRKAIRKGSSGRYLAIGDAAYRRLDGACTTYLRSVSTTKKLTGVANVDVDEWPATDGSYPIYCEADTRPDQKSLTTEGSVYDRG
jgi:hypothetical protein